MKLKPRITLNYGAGKPGIAIAHRIIGPFAVHLLLDANRKPIPKHWSVTHVPSGLRCCLQDQTFDSIAGAIDWIDQLQAFGSLEEWATDVDSCIERLREWKAVCKRLDYVT